MFQVSYKSYKRDPDVVKLWYLTWEMFFLFSILKIRTMPSVFLLLFKAILRHSQVT